MTKFEVMHKTVAVVSFHEPEKAKTFFLSEKWQKSFWEVADLEDLASKMADSFAREGDQYKREIGFFREMEGYGTFVQDKDDEDLFSSSEFSWGGMIDIRIEAELEHASTRIVGGR